MSLHTPTAQLDSALALFADIALHPSFPAHRSGARAQGAPDGAAAGARPWAGDRRPRLRAARVRRAASVRTSTRRHGSGGGAISRDDVQRFYTRTSVRTTRHCSSSAMCGRTTSSAARRHCSAAGRAATSRRRLRHSRRPRQRRSFSWTSRVPRSRRSASAAVGARASTNDYFAAPCDEHDAGRVVHEPAQSEPARDARLHIWRAVRVRYRRSAGPFIASAEVVTAKTDSAFVEFMKELRAIRDTSRRGARGRRNATCSSAARGFETTGGIASSSSARHVRHPARFLRHSSAAL